MSPGRFSMESLYAPLLSSTKMYGSSRAASSTAALPVVRDTRHPSMGLPDTGYQSLWSLLPSPGASCRSSTTAK